ncbi:MAG: hypothetical protein ACRC6M_20300 [Microcystaceae cyanobacterium]
MTITSEKQFIKALELCQLLIQDLEKPSVLPCQAITLLCEVAAKPEDLLKYNQTYSQKHSAMLNSLKSFDKGNSSGGLQCLTIGKTENQSEIDKALDAIDKYARSADNWRVIGENCNLGFGVRDHCSILDFLFKFPSSNFINFTGNFKSGELICEILQDWRGINLLPWLVPSPQLLTL